MYYKRAYIDYDFMYKANLENIMYRQQIKIYGIFGVNHFVYLYWKISDV